MSKVAQWCLISGWLILCAVVVSGSGDDDLPNLTIEPKRTTEAASFKYSESANVAHQNGSTSSPRISTQVPQRDPIHLVWINSLTATFVISALPYLVLYFIPLDNSPEYESFLRILLGFASGGLLGDAFLELIPHSFMVKPSEAKGVLTAETKLRYLYIGLWILVGLIAFFVVEKFVRIINQRSQKSKMDSNENAVQKSKASANAIHITGYLNLVADCAHNFTDGLAIGASFLVGRNVGLVTTMSILVHEIPHEVGDFAMLVRSGFPRAKAMSLQLLTALGAFSGTIFSILVGETSSGASNWIFPFAAGGFIYVATVPIIPDLLRSTKLEQAAKEIAALLLGIGMMVCVAQFE